MGRKVVRLHDVFHFVSHYQEASLPAIQGVVMMVWISLIYDNGTVSRVGLMGIVWIKWRSL